MGRNHFPQSTILLPKNLHRLYYSNILTLILTSPNEEKEPFHSVILILSYHTMKTSALQSRQNQNQRTRLVKQKSFLKQSLALKSRLLSKSTMLLILILIQSQFQTQIEKTEALTLIQILKLEILGLGLGPVALDMRRLEMEHNRNLMMNWKKSRVLLLLLLRLLVRPSRVLNLALVQSLTTAYHHLLHPHISTDHLPTLILTDTLMDLQDHPDEAIHTGTALAQAGMAPISIVMREEDMNVVGEGG